MFGSLRKKQKEETKYIGTTGLSLYTVTKSIEKNEEMIYSIFKDDATLRVRKFQSNKSASLKGFIVYIQGMVDIAQVTRSILIPITNAEISDSKVNTIDQIAFSILSSSDIQETSDTNDFVKAILAGDTVLFVEGEDKVLVLCTKGYKGRSITEPEQEKNLRGPKEGFVEILCENVTMIRRKIISNDLKVIYKVMGKRTNTKVAILYLESLVNDDILSELYRRLEKVNIDGIIDSNYINELIKDSTLTPFKTIGVTERPDVVTSKLLEGRIAFLIEGSPNVLTMPYIFIENFQTSDDYYVNYVYSTFNRLIRVLSFFISILTPSVYLSLVTYHRELIPTDLALSIAQARNGVPFPTLVEMLILLVIFEIIRETSLRTHSNVMQAISIVGALVIGQAAVQAKLVSAPVVIVVSITAITELINPKVKGATILLRILFIFTSSFIGFFGVIFSLIIVLTHLYSLRSFGVNYMTQSSSFRLQEFKDFLIRAPWYMHKTRPKFIAEDKIMADNRKLEPK